MTSVEKKLNRKDLVAYKNYDNKQYSVIPGHTFHQQNILKKTFHRLSPEAARGESNVSSRNGNRNMVNMSMDNIGKARSLLGSPEKGHQRHGS
eukprot:CAMPEP_0202964728 /NCGR_PEP_ID=MMETSP1396-20130829/8824_1 /ASSEMBLY_ACC=CAM_ASM_000872 /TAXON_ID= /ORGANISM="Pseudokeronopsis sp., Strain Brazil" /LENGTH=92 /DNA_ID=CAMNT_0049687063 /DNA_START=1005 /DNA_END=1283 /DNA_ORIENTATION=+